MEGVREIVSQVACIDLLLPSAYPLLFRYPRLEVHASADAVYQMLRVMQRTNIDVDPSHHAGYEVKRSKNRDSRELIFGVGLPL
jgi:hypothetical protein